MYLQNGLDRKAFKEKTMKLKKEHERNMSLTVKGSIPELKDTVKFSLLKNDVKKPFEILCIDILNPDQEVEAGISLDRKTAIEALELILKELKNV